MKRTNTNYFFTAFLALLIILSINGHAFGQPPPPPPGGSAGTGHNLNANQGGAPVGEGIWILLTLAISYGIHGYLRRKENEGDESLPDKLVTAEPNTSGWESNMTGLKAFINYILRPFHYRILHNHKN